MASYDQIDASVDIAVSPGGSLTVPYPPGKAAADYAALGALIYIRAFGTIYASDAGQFTYELNESSVALTLVSVPALPAGTAYRLSLPLADVDPCPVDWDDVGGKPSFAAVATSGAYSDLSGKPSLATDATPDTDSEKLSTPADVVRRAVQAVESSRVVSFTSARFGGLLDGSNETAKLAAFLQYCGANNVVGVIPKGVLGVDPQEVVVAGDLRIQCDATIFNRLGSSMAAAMLRLTGSGTREHTLNWRGGFFNCNGGGYSGFEVKNWRISNVHVDEGANIICVPGSTGSTSNLVFANVTHGRASWGLMRDCSEGTSSQGSLPRAFSASMDDGLRSDIVVQAGDVRDHHGCVVVDDLGPVENPGTLTIYGNGVWKDTSDNGIYLVGRASRVDAYNLIMDNVEEPLVNSGGGCVLRMIGGAILNPKNSIGLQDCPGVHLKGVRVVTTNTVARTRGPDLNTASGSFVIEDCDIEVRGASPPFIFHHGTLETFRERNCRIRIINDTSIGALPENILYMEGPGSNCSFDATGGEWILEDATSDIASKEYYVNIPTVTRQSLIDSKFINQTGNSGAVLRLVDARQKLMSLRGFFSQYNAQKDIPQNNSAPDQALRREVFGDYFPTDAAAGYWNKGDIFWNTNPTALGMLGWVCVTSGTPGTWAAIGVAPIILSGVTTYDWPSIAAGATATRTVSVTGAAPGDFVIGVAMGTYTAGITFSGQVSAADVVTVTARNNTESAIDMASGQLRVRVMRLSAA